MTNPTKEQVESATFSLREQAGEIVRLANRAPELFTGDDPVACDLLLAHNAIVLVCHRFGILPAVPMGVTGKPRRVA